MYTYREILRIMGNANIGVSMKEYLCSMKEYWCSMKENEGLIIICKYFGCTYHQQEQEQLQVRVTCQSWDLVRQGVMRNIEGGFIPRDSWNLTGDVCHLNEVLLCI
uniref:Uncharacterized protein n=1 Tax=Cacopsylla melanoneura TaxID=428564 RepID=A0A8D8PLP0_9HEMI